VEGLKWCECGASFKPVGSTKTCSEECRAERKRASNGSVHARHACLVRQLEKERIPRTDKLWSANFYEGLIEGNECSWCSGPLSRSGHALDRIDPDKGHLATNVLTACGLCNRIHSGPDKNGNAEQALTFEEMKILRPGLVQIRNRRGNLARN
jgi:hypothetical protein